jgi:hypothetical protein
LKLLPQKIKDRRKKMSLALLLVRKVKKERKLRNSPMKLFMRMNNHLPWTMSQLINLADLVSPLQLMLNSYLRQRKN